MDGKPDPLCVCGHAESDHDAGICDGCLESDELWLDALHEFTDAERRRKELH